MSTLLELKSILWRLILEGAHAYLEILKDLYFNMILEDLFLVCKSQMKEKTRISKDIIF